MSSNSPADVIDFEATLQQLEVATERSSTLQELLADTLNVLTQSMRAQAGVIWLADASRNLRPTYQDRWTQLGIATDPERATRHRQLIAAAASRQQVLMVGPHNRPADDLPLPLSFLLVPIIRDGQLLGVIEVVLSARDLQEHAASLLQILEHAKGHVETFQEGDQTCFRPVETVAFWHEVEPFFYELYQHLDSRQLAYSSSSTIRDLLGVDRVAVFQYFGRRPQALGVSGQVKVSRHSPQMKQLRKVVKDVIDTKEMFLHSRQHQVDESAMADTVSEYLTETNTQMLAVVPLWSTSEADTRETQPNREQRDRRIVGALIVERARSSSFDSAHQEVLRLLADHLGNALHRSHQHESIFLLPLWRGLGQSCRWLKRHKFWQSLAVLMALVAFFFAMIAVPRDYRVTGKGQLMPIVQQQVFAPWDAEVEEVLVSGGEKVQAGQPLVQLVSKELEAEEIRLRTLIEEKRTSLNALRSAREASQRANDREKAIDIEGRYAEHQVEIQHLREQHRLILTRLENLTVTAPRDGIVATFQVDQLLEDRPVNRGDLLLEVMDASQGWHLELKVEDRRMGHLLSARKEKKTLPVEYILVTQPETSYTGELKTIGLRANPDPEKGNVVDVHVRLHKPPTEKESGKRSAPGSSSRNPLPPDAMRVGASVKARISCGDRALGYVLFGDVIEYLRKTLWL